MQTEINTATLNEGDLFQTSLTTIIPEPHPLRVPDKGHEDYKNLKADIAKNGLKTPILVRANPDDPDGFIVINGGHRFAVLEELYAEDLEINPNAEPPMVPCMFDVVEDGVEIWFIQMSTNIQQVATKPIELRRAIQGISANAEAKGHPLTQAEIAKSLNKSQAWVSKIMQLGSLHPDLEGPVNEGKIPLVSASLLARMDEASQLEWGNRAQTLSTDEFGNQATQYLNEMKKSGKKADPNEFTPQFKLMKKTEAMETLADLTEQVKSNLEQDQLNEYSTIISEAFDGGEMPDLFLLGMLYGFQQVLGVDEASIAKQKAEHQAMINDRARKRAEKASSDAAADAAASQLGFGGRTLPTV